MGDSCEETDTAVPGTCETIYNGRMLRGAFGELGIWVYEHDNALY
jgi:hypothetical protein